MLNPPFGAVARFSPLRAHSEGFTMMVSISDWEARTLVHAQPPQSLRATLEFDETIARMEFLSANVSSEDYNEPEHHTAYHQRY
jgi:hypothetical protein